MSNGKCCYCETKLVEEGKYMQVDHYPPKSKYPYEVLEWENLLLSCGMCNNKKRAYDTALEPIINPTEHKPKEYLHLRNFLYVSKNRN